jgi:hypothetical protein
MQCCSLDRSIPPTLEYGPEPGSACRPRPHSASTTRRAVHVYPPTDIQGRTDAVLCDEAKGPGTSVVLSVYCFQYRRLKQDHPGLQIRFAMRPRLGSGGCSIGQPPAQADLLRVATRQKQCIGYCGCSAPLISQSRDNNSGTVRRRPCLVVPIRTLNNGCGPHQRAATRATKSTPPTRVVLLCLHVVEESRRDAQIPRVSAVRGGASP